MQGSAQVSVVASRAQLEVCCVMCAYTTSRLQLESSCPSAFFQGERPLVVLVWSGRMDVICVVLTLGVVNGSECYCPGIWECCNWNQRVTHEHHFDEPVVRNVLRVVLLTASVCVQACQSQDVPCAAFHLVWKIVLRCVGSLFLRFVSKLIGARLFHGRSRAVCPFVRILRTQTC